MRGVRVVATVLVLLLAAEACREAANPASSVRLAATSPASTAAPGTPSDPSARRATANVTTTPCRLPTNPDNGCIHLGVLADFTGADAVDGARVAEAVEAFWDRVNRAGGIGGFDVDVSTWVRDTNGDPYVHAQVYDEIEPEILALAMTHGSAGTAAIRDDLAADTIVAAPADRTSAHVFDPATLEHGTSYCIEAMNAVAWADETVIDDGLELIMAIHHPDPTGVDAAAGARAAAAGLGAQFVRLDVMPGTDGQNGATDAVIALDPDLVVLATQPEDTAQIVELAAFKDFAGQFVGIAPSWDQRTWEDPLFDVARQYHQARPTRIYETGEGRGFDALRMRFGDDGDDATLTGWISQYALKAALEAAIAADDLTRAGLRDAAAGLQSVDYEGMLPEGSGEYAAGEAFPREIVIARPDDDRIGGLTARTEFVTSDLAADFEYGGAPCG